MTRKKSRDDSRTGLQNVLAGRKPVLEILSRTPEKVEHVVIQKGADRTVSQIIDKCRELKVRFRLASRVELDRMYPGNHQGVVAAVFSSGFSDLDAVLEAARQSPLPVVAALDQVQDPGNVGVLARTLYALGGGGIIVPKNRSALLGAGAVKASAGALALLPVAKVVNLSRALEEAADQGFHVYGAGTGGNNVFLEDLKTPAVLVLGGEEAGIRAGVLKRVQSVLTVPMAREFDSINVAQAGAVILAQFACRAEGARE